MENVNKNKKRGRPSKIKDEFTPFATRLRSLGENMTHQEIADGVGVSTNYWTIYVRQYSSRY